MVNLLTLSTPDPRTTPRRTDLDVAFIALRERLLASGLRYIYCMGPGCSTQLTGDEAVPVHVYTNHAGVRFVKWVCGLCAERFAERLDEYREEMEAA